MKIYASTFCYLFRTEKKTGKKWVENSGDKKKKSKERYSHKDKEKDKTELNPNSSNPNTDENDKKRKKRKKYVIYSENSSAPPEGSVQNENGINMENNGVFECVSNIREIIPVYSKLIGLSENNNTEKYIENDENKHDVEKIAVTSNTEKKSADDKKLEIINEKLRAEKRKEQEAMKLDEETLSTALKEEEEQERNEEEKEEVSRKGGRGTFSVGCLPKPLNCPKGNKLFPGKSISFLFSFLFLSSLSQRNNLLLILIQCIAHIKSMNCIEDCHDRENRSFHYSILPY